MAGHSNEQLLAILRNRHVYVPEAVTAAIAELKRREVSGFDVSNALDEGNELASLAFQAAELRLSWQWMLFWILLPLLAITPFGAWHFKRYVNAGQRRRSIMFIEAATIGFMGYMVVLLVAMNWV